jgi:hypothetical protein
LLRARRERPRRGHAAEQRDEVAPFHSITSSARPDSGSGTVMPSVLAVLRFTHISVGHQMPGPLKRGRTQVAEQNDVTKLYEEFEEAFVDVLTAKSEGVSFNRRMKLRLARVRLRSIQSTRLSALVTDWAMETWYHPPLHE